MGSPKVLFIIKRFHDYGSGCAPLSSGLRNSVEFVVEQLQAEGYDVALATAIDGNCIDRLVTQYRPRRAVLEALWVTPEKIRELKRLHPHVHWTVRIHSEIPFLATEGVATQWLAEYERLGVEVAFNSYETARGFKVLGRASYLPNLYPLGSAPPVARSAGAACIHIGCFGALRPLKNQLIQALAAIHYTHKLRTPLAFHINAGRVEQGGSTVLANLRALFQHVHGARLIEHEWLAHDDFLTLLTQMDVVMQVSFSESFCIVAADAVSLGVPVIGSAAIRWLPSCSAAEPGDYGEIVGTLDAAGPMTATANWYALREHLLHAGNVWREWMHGATAK